MERNRCWFRSKIVLLVVATCLVETTSITNQVTDQKLPETNPKRSLVALVQERFYFHTIPTGSMGNGASASARANPSTEAERNVGENDLPKPGAAKPKKSVVGKNEPTVAEVMHFLKQGQIPFDGRTANALQRNTINSKQGETGVVGFLQRTNGQSVVSQKRSKLHANRFRRGLPDVETTSLPTTKIASDSLSIVAKTTSKLSPSSLNLDIDIDSSDAPPNAHPVVSSGVSGYRPAVNLPPSQSLSPMLPEGTTEGPMLVPEPSTNTPSDQEVVTTLATPSNLLPVAASIHYTENHLQTTSTSQPSPVSTVANRRLTSTPRTKRPEPPVAKTSPPQTNPQSKLSSKHRTAVSQTTVSTSLPPSPLPMNATASMEAQLQDVKERTRDGDCASGNCDPALMRTDDAYWAFGSLLSILLILTACVLYTGLWKKRNNMSTPISDVNCHPQASPSRKSKTNIKDLLKTKLGHIKSFNNSPLSSTSPSLSKQDTRQHNGSSSSNGRAGNRYPHRYDRLPLLGADENEEEEFTRDWGPRAGEHGV